jgi:hypothetical protein
MGSYSLFQIWEPSRQSLIAQHHFQYEQSCKRLLSQFNNIEAEANKAAGNWLNDNAGRFNPDAHDPSDFSERAYEEGAEFYRLLKEMENNTILSVVSGMYHEWDKQFRDWIVNEINHLHRGDNVKGKIWSVDIGKLFDLFEGLGWKIRNKKYFDYLYRCRLVVNVYKHGKGKSFDELKAKYPEYFYDFLKTSDFSPTGSSHINHTDLVLSVDQLKEFSQAIVSFWEDIPKDIVDSASSNIPIWFEKAFLKDQKISNGVP